MLAASSPVKLTAHAAEGHGDRQQHPRFQRFEESEVEGPGAATRTGGNVRHSVPPSCVVVQSETDAGAQAFSTPMSAPLHNACGGKIAKATQSRPTQRSIKRSQTGRSRRLSGDTTRPPIAATPRERIPERRQDDTDSPSLKRCKPTRFEPDAVSDHCFSRGTNSTLRAPNGSISLVLDGCNSLKPAGARPQQMPAPQCWRSGGNTSLLGFDSCSRGRLCQRQVGNSSKYRQAHTHLANLEIFPQK